MLTRLITLCSILLVLVTLSACNGSSSEPQDNSAAQPTERVAMLMGGRPHAEAITETGKATAYRILNPEDGVANEKLGSAVALSAEQRAALIKLIASDDSYEWTIAKGCEPLPGILVTFEDGATYARLRICLECKMLGFTPGDWEDFDPIYDDLLKWAKNVFPDDQVIQGL